MAKKRPNILFLFTDQLRADCIAALGNSQIKTPNIDRLVQQGTAFTRAYTPSPVCVPARHALTSGTPVHQSGCFDNVDVPCERSSMMDLLNAQGYQTHGVGKMHFIKSKGDWGFESRDISEELSSDSANDDYRDFLVEQGYEHVLDPHGLRSEFYYVPQPSQLPDRLHNNAWVADRSIDFLNNHDTERPFFLWSSFIKPHPPFETPTPWSRLYRLHEMEEPYRPEGYEEVCTYWNKVQNRYKYRDGGYDRNMVRMIKAAYYCTVSHVDYHLGRILDALGDKIDDTLIVFSADHGEMLGDYGCYGKRCMLEPSANVPLIARLPGSFEAGATCPHPANLLDLFPTFTGEEAQEGVSLYDLSDPSHADRITYSQFSDKGSGLYMAASQDWKYVYSAADNKEWLFKKGDELTNHFGNADHADALSKLKGSLIKRFQDDNYSDPLDGDDWHKWETQSIPEDPDGGLLFQDPPLLDPQLAALPGYARDGVDKSLPRYQIIPQKTPPLSEQ